MIPAERQSHILRLLAGRPAIGIGELTQTLNVSHMTVRRDLAHLARSGRVVPVSGGVRLADPVLSQEAPHHAKAALHRDIKLALGARAAATVPPGAAVYLDAGTTMLAVADALTGRDDLTIVTNDFVVLERLAARTRAVIHHTGGLLDRENRSAIGEGAARAIGAFRLDIAFISSSSFGARGLSVTDPGKGQVKEAAVANATAAILVADSSKFGRRAPYASLPLAAFSRVITDGGLPAEACRAVEACGPRLDIVEPGAQR